MANLHDPIQFGCRIVHTATQVQPDQMKIIDPLHSDYRPILYLEPTLWVCGLASLEANLTLDTNVHFHHLLLLR